MGSIISIASIGGVLAILSMVFTQLIANKFKAKLRSQTKKVKLFSLNSLIYLAATILLLTLPVLLVFLIDKIGIMWLYVIVGIYAAIGGAIHIKTHYKYVKWAEKAVDMLPDILYTIVIALMASVLFMFIYQKISGDTEHYISFFVILFPFIIGMFVLKTVTLYNLIPELEYHTFKVSKGDRRVTPAEIRNSAKRSVNFHLKTKPENEKREKIEASLFSDVEFGVCVFHILEEYNTRPELPSIMLRDEAGEEQEFIFYFKPKFLGIKKLIDPLKSVLDNNIGNKANIVFHSIKNEND